MGQHPVPQSQSNTGVLTRREMEILALLAQVHLTNRDIAEQLFLAPNSIKWYIRQIYAKLGVTDRRQAIIRASDIGFMGFSPYSMLVNHLPIPFTQFVGREKDVNKIGQMLADPENRLITLTGTGGVGKTRLALRVANENQGKYPHGVWSVDMSALSQDHLVPERTAAVFNLLGNENRDPIRVLKDFLSASKLLLILDSCEHLVNACATMVEYLLQNCPHLQIMATSREALGISGEMIYVVPPLDIPDLETQPDIKQLIANEAVQLFMNRAAAVKPTFRISQGNQKTVAYICNRLEGIPLALELAAARLKVLEIDQIARYLESNFLILSGGRRTAPVRHQTMTASIDWSYRLLSAAEQSMLQKLSIFNGGWTLEAAQSVCEETSRESVSDTKVIDLISQLIDKSLIIFAQKKLPNLDRSGESDLSEKYRYHMLEPIQQYAREKLRENNDEKNIRDLHLSYFLTLAEKAEPLFRGPDQVDWLDQLELEIDNFRLALAWAFETNPEAGLRLGSALIWFWHIRGSWAEGLDWLRKGLNSPIGIVQKIPLQGSSNREQVSNWVRAKSLCAAGVLQNNLLVQQNDFRAFDQVFALFQESLAILRRQRPQDRSGMAFALLQLAKSATDQLSTDEVTTWANQSLALYREEEDRFGISECLMILANNEQNLARAKEAFEETIKIKRKIGDIDGLAFTYMNASSLSVSEGDYEQAHLYLLESLNFFLKVGNQSYIARILNRLAWVDWVKGDSKEALAHIEKAQEICERNSLFNTYAQNLLLRCEILLSLGRLEEAKQNDLEALGIGQDHNIQLVMISAKQIQGEIAWLQDDDRTAIKSLETALAINRMTGNQSTTAGLLYWLGRVKLSAGDLLTGKSLLFESIEKYIGLPLWHYWFYLAYPLEALASIAVVEQKIQHSTQLYAKASRLFPLLQNTLSPRERLHRENEISMIKTTLGEEAFHQCWQMELRIPMDQMIINLFGGVNRDLQL